MPPFLLWGPAHLGAVVISFSLPLLVCAWARRDPTGERARQAARVLAGVLILNLIAHHVWWYSHFPSLRKMLPLHLCDWTMLACILAAWTRSRLAFECAYFFGLPGGLVSVLTPITPFGFPTVPFWIFFVGHGGILLMIVILTIGMQQRPSWKSLARVYGVFVVYLITAGIANILLGTNYGWLRRKPVSMRLYDWFGPWPWYIATAMVIVLALFVLGYLPWALADRRRARSAPKADAPLFRPVPAGQTAGISPVKWPQPAASRRIGPVRAI